MNLRNYFLAVGLVLICARVVASAAAPAVKWHPGHYIYVGHGNVSSVIELKQFRGVQKFYTWTKLEPEQGRYDFSSIRNDLALLKQHGKQLVIQLQYKAFVRGERFTPSYIRGPEYGGGVFRNGMGAHDPVLWNSNVGERMDALYAALGRAFDSEPGLEAAVLPETSPCHNLEKFPQPGVEPFTTDLYVAALKQRMLALRKAFPNTAVIQYVNYPKQVLPQLTDYMKDIGVGIGGPDFYPRPSALSDPEKGVYRLYPKLAGTVPLGAAVQAPDYSVALWKRTAGNQGGDKSPVTAEDEIPIPIRDFLKLAQELNLNYLFWQNYPPSCFENVKKFLAELDLVSDPAGGLATQLPSKVFLATASETKSESAKPLAPPAALHAADFYVATNGSDRNPGTKDQPFKTISAGVGKLKAGDSLLIGPGVYRETIKVTSSGVPGQPITIAAEKKGTVTIRGSALVTGWRRSEENSKMFIHEGWDKYFGKWDESLVKGGDQFKAKFGDPKTTQTMAFNQVFVNGTLIREVACAAKREAGTFYVDKEKKQIHLWLSNDTDPNQSSVEVTDRDVLLQVMNVSHLHVKGLQFEHCANGMMGQAAVLFRGGRNNLIEDCVIQHTAMGALLMSGDNHVVRRCVMNHNGQQGFTSSGSENILIEDSETSFNNCIPWKRVSPAFKCGGFKVQSSHKVKFLRHTAISNYGPGLWFDVSNDDCEVANCYAADNRAGILNEISFRIHVHDSVFVNNNPNNGISIAESPGNVIERNIVIDNGCGVYIRDMLRSTPEVSIVNGRMTIGKPAPIWNHDEVVRQNVFLNNKKAQINFGVQGINANRQVPQRLLGSEKLIEQGKKIARDEMTKLGEDYVDKHGVTLSMQPKGLYLEKLNFVINGNVYWSGGKGPLMQWGNLLIYRNLADLRATEGFEKDGVVLDPQFADWKNLDLRVPSDSPLLKSGCYPQGEVPRVKLGVIQ